MFLVAILCTNSWVMKVISFHYEGRLLRDEVKDVYDLFI
jgi:hypothetical protein